jgi:hypothetical protein
MGLLPNKQTSIAGWATSPYSPCLEKKTLIPFVLSLSKHTNLFEVLLTERAFLAVKVEA